MAASAVQPAGKDCGRLQHVIGQLFLERTGVTVVDDDDLDPPGFARREDEFRAKTQQAVLVDQHQPANLPIDDGAQQLGKALHTVIRS